MSADGERAVDANGLARVAVRVRLVVALVEQKILEILHNHERVIVRLQHPIVVAYRSTLVQVDVLERLEHLLTQPRVLLFRIAVEIHNVERGRLPGQRVVHVGEAKILARFLFGRKKNGLIAFVGPQRMGGKCSRPIRAVCGQDEAEDARTARVCVVAFGEIDAIAQIDLRDSSRCHRLTIVVIRRHLARCEQAIAVVQ